MISAHVFDPLKLGEKEGKEVLGTEQRGLSVDDPGFGLSVCVPAL